MTQEARDRALWYMVKYCDDRKCDECVFNFSSHNLCAVARCVQHWDVASNQEILDVVGNIPWPDRMKLKEEYKKQEANMKFDEERHDEILPDQMAKADADKLTELTDIISTDKTSEKEKAWDDEDDSR